MFIIESGYPNSELKYTPKENDHAADLNGLQFVASVVRELVRQLVGQGQTSDEGQREGVQQAHEARRLRDMEEERVVNEPEQADGDEGTKVGEVLRAVVLQGCDQAAAILLLHGARVGHVVLAERE